MSKTELFNDHFQNFKRYQIPKAQLIITDPPYNIGVNAYASNPSWYVDGDNRNGESTLAGREFFDTDKDFRPAEFMHFCSQMLVKEPKEAGKAPCMIIFCEFEQQFKYIELGKRYGFQHYINLVFRKNFSAQVLKANMKVVGNCEYGLILYKDKLPKFNNNGGMVFNCFDWVRDNKTPKIHPCLPKGEKVFFNNRWMNIENVKKGDHSAYGEVVETSSHFADKIIEITTDDGTARATWNHPFLVLRGNEIAWVHAELIRENDEILWRANLKTNTNPQRKVISGLEGKEKRKWSMCLFGKTSLARFLKGFKSITLMGTRKTIILQTSNLSLPLSIKGYTKVASLSLMNGLNHVQYAANTSDATGTTGIIHGDGLMELYAKNVTSKKWSGGVRFVPRKVLNVKTILGKTEVYNVTLCGVPAFDTAVGCSHNTQKPVPLLEQLISIFTDPGDVVIDPCAGSGTTLLAAANTGRRAYGFEIKKNFYKLAKEKVLREYQPKLFV